MLLLALAAALTGAAADRAGADAVKAKAEQSEEKLVCRSVKVTGTRFGKRYCKPAKAWQTIEDKSVESVREIQNRPAINPTSPSGGAS